MHRHRDTEQGDQVREGGYEKGEDLRAYIRIADRVVTSKPARQK
jgi:hypothetical protein